MKREILDRNSRLAHLGENIASSFLIWLCIVLIVLKFFSLHSILFLFVEKDNLENNLRLVIYNTLSDDAFYYLEIAKNIIEKNFSSFDGITRTNGYHPLWMLILVGLGGVAPVDSLTYALLLRVLIIIIVAVGSFLFDQVRKQYSLDNFKSPLVVAYFFSGLYLSKGGLEVCLIFLFLPLFILSTCALIRNPDNYVAYFAAGLTASLLLLSRLDTIILISIMTLAFLCYTYKVRATTLTSRNSLTCILGLTPFLVYLLYNFILYNSVVPISGQAKSLHFESFIISRRGFYSILYWISHVKVLAGFLATTLLGMPLVIVSTISKRRWIDWTMILIVFYPVIFFGFYLVRSDWPFWHWYYYPLSISFAFSLMVFEAFAKRFQLYQLYQRHKLFVTTAICLVILLWATPKLVKMYFSPGRFIPQARLNAALQITNFARDNPGIYAMGDRAGIVGFLLPQPLIQLEGLVSDNEMLKNISAERNLIRVLHDYSVDYYIATDPEAVGNCWYLEEPRQPGQYAPRMRAKVCNEPIFYYKGNGTATIFSMKNATATDE